MLATTLLAHAALLTRLTAPYPFAVGETLEYEAKLGVIPIGTARMTVNPMTRERGAEAFVFAATGAGRPMGIRMGADLTSYVGARGFNSLRFHRKLYQGGSVDESLFQMVPDSSRYREAGVPHDWAAPRDPLDELAFLYYLRTAPLKVGTTYQIPRYFKTGYNPIRVRVLNRVEWQLPDGRTVPAFNLEITSRNLLMNVTMTDDARRLPVELDLPLPFGRVTLELTSASGGRAVGRSGGQ
ncbi:MAG: DUF3108 domain-containing protein [Gemmatimonadales bacterium]